MSETRFGFRKRSMAAASAFVLLLTGCTSAEPSYDYRDLTADQAKMYVEKSARCITYFGIRTGKPETSPLKDTSKEVATATYTDADGNTRSIGVIVDKVGYDNDRAQAMGKGIVATWNNPEGAYGIRGDSAHNLGKLVVLKSQSTLSSEEIIGTMCNEQM